MCFIVVLIYKKRIHDHKNTETINLINVIFLFVGWTCPWAITLLVRNYVQKHLHAWMLNVIFCGSLPNKLPLVCWVVNSSLISSMQFQHVCHYEIYPTIKKIPCFVKHFFYQEQHYVKLACLDVPSVSHAVKKMCRMWMLCRMKEYCVCGKTSVFFIAFSINQ